MKFLSGIVGFDFAVGRADKELVILPGAIDQTGQIGQISRNFLIGPSKVAGDLLGKFNVLRQIAQGAGDISAILVIVQPVILVFHEILGVFLAVQLHILGTVPLVAGLAGRISLLNPAGGIPICAGKLLKKC